MRKAVYVITTLLVLSALLSSIQPIQVVQANPFMFGPHIGIVSPQQFVEWNHKYQTIYQTTSIPIQIQINTPLDYPKIIKVYYVLDYNHSLNNNPQKTLTISNPQTSTYSGVGSTLYWATGTLKNLSNGTHTVDVWALDAEGHTAKSGTNNFLVNETSTAKSEQPFLLKEITIVLVTALIAVTIGTVTVILLKRRKVSR
jgi:hypothetical protein